MQNRFHISRDDVIAAGRYAIWHYRRANPSDRVRAFDAAAKRFWAHLDATGVRLSPPREPAPSEPAPVGYGTVTITRPAGRIAA